jgi:hypothetical protein
MSWTQMITDLATNLGFALPDLLLIMTALGCIILFAKDFKIGLISMFMLFSIEFIIFANLGWDTTHVIIIMFMAMALMVVSLFMGESKSNLN